MFNAGFLHLEGLEVCCRFSWSCDQQPWQSDKIGGSHGQVEAGAHPLRTAMDGPDLAVDGLYQQKASSIRLRYLIERA